MNSIVQNKQTLLSEFSDKYDLCRRYGINQAQIRTRIFNPLKFPKVKISEDHQAACEKYASMKSESELQSIINDILASLEKFIVFNDKVVQFYDLSEAQLKAIESSVEHEISVWSIDSLKDYYPGFPSDPSVISKDLQPIKSLIFGKVKVFLIGSRREYYKVFPLSKKDLKPSAANAILDIKEVTAKGMVSELAVDVVALDYENSRLELRLSNADNMSKSNQSDFQKKLISYVQNALGAPLGQPYDFLGKVNDYYFADDYGRLLTLDFLTEQGAERSEKFKSKSDDLKAEDYHIGGTTKVNNIFQGFGITKVWDFGEGDSSYQLTMKVKGTSSLIRKGGQTVEQVYLLDCFDESEYNYLTSKLLL